MVRNFIPLVVLLALVGCGSTPVIQPEQAESQLVCDSYVIFDMCVRDLSGDGTVDMVYFSDTQEIFMYQNGRRRAVAQVMPLHRCAVPLNAGMQETCNRILNRSDLSLGEELDITRQLIANYVAAKPEIDTCNARYEEFVAEDEFNPDDSDWDEE